MRLTKLPVWAVLACVFAGCGGDGPSLHPVTGTLTRGGKALVGVNVTFTPETGPSSAGRTNAEGKFVLVSASGKQGAVVGKHDVVLSGAGGSAGGSEPFDPTNAEKMSANRDSQMQGGKRGAPTQLAPKTEFPPEYADAQKALLHYEVKAGKNDFDIPIP